MVSIISVILLYLISVFNGDRTISGIYHLLQGKRSSQTIQDGHLYRCLFLFGILPRFKRNWLEKELDDLLSNHYIIKEKEMTFRITKIGEETLKRQLDDYQFIFYINGWKYKENSSVFWSRLVLIVQSISCINDHNYNFFPVIKDQQVKLWVKNHFPKPNERSHFSMKLYSELSTLINDLSKLEAEIFTYKLSGSHRIGLTNEQLATYYGKEKMMMELIHLSVVHRILERLYIDRKDFPILSSIISDLNRTMHMTNSTRQTYQMMKRGLSIEEIATRRQLKVSTIEDHIIEIMLEDKTAKLASFITDKELGQILQVIKKNTNHLKLSHIKEQLPREISYFKIRLTLARLTDYKD
ncbi:helix-turn-helix domain-containing protein [Alkalihalobacillus sp. BA299]|uniref:helix-turn-helix domain-containing protein n=1 Tax=Alkalihalobacillus sp. BA299 TaxID=2815938 RepID=UPI001ADB9A4C|nr:helix-turn-helix domain-containing protein [Alkalihalobacillus sp. BA299]